MGRNNGRYAKLLLLRFVTVVTVGVMVEKLTNEAVRKWFIETSGGRWVTRPEMDTELEIGTPKGLTTRRVILGRLLRQGFIEEHPFKPHMYRLLDNNAPLIEWQTADISSVVDMHWPFKIHQWVNLYPKNIAVVAGSPNAGKTALCFNLIKLNQHRAEIADWLPIEYFTSELGAEEMKLRLSKFNISDWSFNARERSDNFSEVIQPNKINIIDYLEIVDNFYLVAREINRIFNKLERGIAILMLQKNPSTKDVKIKLGRGGTFSLEKPRLYIAMDEGELTIVKGKNWAVEGQNPNGQKWTFKLVDGYKFIPEKI